MAIIDRKHLMSFNQDLAQIAGDYDSTDYIDKGEGVDEFGSAKIPSEGVSDTSHLNVIVTESFVGATATVLFKLQDSADGLTWADTTITTGAIAVASLTAGTKVINQMLPRGLRRYLKMVYTIGTATTTAGEVSAWVGSPQIDK